MLTLTKITLHGSNYNTPVLAAMNIVIKNMRLNRIMFRDLGFGIDSKIINDLVFHFYDDELKKTVEIGNIAGYLITHSLCDFHAIRYCCDCTGRDISFDLVLVDDYAQKIISFYEDFNIFDCYERMRCFYSDSEIDTRGLVVDKDVLIKEVARYRLCKKLVG